MWRRVLQSMVTNVPVLNAEASGFSKTLVPVHEICFFIPEDRDIYETFSRTLKQNCTISVTTTRNSSITPQQLRSLNSSIHRTRTVLELQTSSILQDWLQSEEQTALDKLHLLPLKNEFSRWRNWKTVSLSNRPCFRKISSTSAAEPSCI
jgi:hypothetical protein